LAVSLVVSFKLDENLTDNSPDFNNLRYIQPSSLSDNHHISFIQGTIKGYYYELIENFLWIQCLTSSLIVSP